MATQMTGSDYVPASDVRWAEMPEPSLAAMVEAGVDEAVDEARRRGLPWFE